MAASCGILSFHLANDPTLGEVLVLMTIWRMAPECRAVPDAQFRSGRFGTRDQSVLSKGDDIFSMVLSIPGTVNGFKFFSFVQQL
jgi:hypothetical protein